MESVQDAAPVDLVDIACGTEHWRYNSTAGDISYAGYTYKPQAGLMCGDIEIARNVLRSTWEVTVPWSCVFVQEYLDGAPENVVTITNYRGQYNAAWDALYERVWAGFVKGVKFQESRKAIIRCVPAHAEIGTTGLALRCGRLCQVPLYSDACGLSKGDYLSGGTVEAISGFTLTSTTFRTQADGYWVGAPIMANGAKRTIIAHAYDVVTLNDTIPNIAIGMTFEAYAGCPRIDAVCDSRFGNLDNFRGQPHIPDKNVFVAGVN